MTKQEFSTALEKAAKKFTDAAYDLGMSPEKTRKLLISKQGQEMLISMIQNS